MKSSTGINILIPCVLLLLTSGAEADSQVVNGSLGGFVYFYESLPVEDNPAITWNFKGKPIAQHLPSGPVCYDPFLGRCDVSANGTLRLDNLAFVDDGEYNMVAQYPNFTILKTSFFTLKVYTALSAAVLRSNVTDNRFINGTYVSLQCDAGSQTVTTYTFYRDGRNICSEPHVSCDGSTLRFQPITVSDNGSYTCTIQNPVSASTSNTLLVAVSVPISAVSLKSNVSEGSLVWAGEESVSFHCSSDGSDVTYSWNLNGQPLTPNPPYHASGDNLIISPVSKNDNGPFTCNASNWIGSKSSNPLSLNLAWRPDGSIACTIQPAGKNVILGCLWPGGQPAANVSLIFSGETVTRTNNVTKEVAVGGDFRGSNFTCHGDQLGRTSQCTQAFAVPEAPGHKNESITSSTVGKTLDLTVNLEPGLPVNFSWYRLNDSVPIQSNGKFTVHDTSTSSTLQIRDVTLEDKGKYVCRAENIIGSQSFLFNVDVQKEDVPPPKPNGLNGGEIAGIVIGVLAGVALIGIAVFFIMKRN